MRRRLSIFVALAAFLLPSPVSALDLGEWVAGLKVSPFVSERTEYEANVFQTPSHAQGDGISRTIPGVLAEYGAAPMSLDAGYRAEILRFFNLPNQDTVHHIALGQFRLELPRLLVNLRDDYKLTSDPPNTELTGRITSTTNVLAPEGEFRLTDRFSAGANYSWTRVDFPKVDQLNREEHLVGGSVFWKFLPKSDLRLNYLHGEKDFDHDNRVRDVTRNLVLLGLRGDLTAKLSSTFRWGYESREPRRSNLKAYHGMVGGGDWIYRPTERTTISLLTDRSIQESTFGNTLYFVSTLVTLQAEHRFVPKLSGNARVTGGDNTYPTKETLSGRTKFRDDTLWGWGAGIDYDIQKWLRVGVDYSHTRRSSNFREFNFSDDKVAGTLTFRF